MASTSLARSLMQRASSGTVASCFRLPVASVTTTSIVGIGSSMSRPGPTDGLWLRFELDHDPTGLPPPADGSHRYAGSDDATGGDPGKGGRARLGRLGDLVGAGGWRRRQSA